jgi:hypothetical protein
MTKSSYEMFETEIAAPRGPGYRQSQVKSWSHYNDPIDTAQDSVTGNSRRAGDASLGSRLIDRQSQNKTVAASATAERKVFAHLS